MQKLKIAYFGTPDFSAHFLEKIITDTDLPIEVVLVVTQADKPVGRKQVLTPSPVKIIAQKYKIAIWDENIEHITYNIELIKEKHIDLALVYAYGEILPQELLTVPKYEFWNIHPSLLPKYRGPSPTAYALIMGDTETGVSLMQMDEKMDHGPLLTQETYHIKPEQRREELQQELTDLGFTIFKTYILDRIEKRGEGSSSTSPTPLFLRTSPPPALQKHEDATFTKLLTKDDGFIPFLVLKKAWTNEPILTEELPQIIKNYYVRNHLSHITYPLSSHLVFNLFRGLHPWPGLWTKVDIQDGEKRLKILDLKLRDNKLEILQVQLEGKNPVDFPTFNRAYPLFF